MTHRSIVGLLRRRGDRRPVVGGGSRQRRLRPRLVWRRDCVLGKRSLVADLKCMHSVEAVIKHARLLSTPGRTRSQIPKSTSEFATHPSPSRCGRSLRSAFFCVSPWCAALPFCFAQSTLATAETMLCMAGSKSSRPRHPSRMPSATPAALTLETAGRSGSLTVERSPRPASVSTNSLTGTLSLLNRLLPSTRYFLIMPFEYRLSEKQRGCDCR